MTRHVARHFDDYFAEKLPLALRAQVEAHLRDCLQCQEEFAILTRVKASFCDLAVPPLSPERVSQAVDAALRHPLPAQSGWRMTVPRFALATAAMLVLIGVFLFPRILSRHDQQVSVPQVVNPPDSPEVLNPLPGPPGVVQPPTPLITPSRRPSNFTLPRTRQPEVPLYLAALPVEDVQTRAVLGDRIIFTLDMRSIPTMIEQLLHYLVVAAPLQQHRLAVLPVRMQGLDSPTAVDALTAQVRAQLARHPIRLLAEREVLANSHLWTTVENGVSTPDQLRDFRVQTGTAYLLLTRLALRETGIEVRFELFDVGQAIIVATTRQALLPADVPTAELQRMTTMRWLIDRVRATNDGAAADALVLAGTPAAKPVLDALIVEYDIEIQRTLAWILGRIKDTHMIVPLLQLLPGAQGESAAAALRDYGALAYTPVVNAWTKERRTPVRLLLLDILSSMDLPRTMPVFLDALRDDEPTVRAAVAEVLVEQSGVDFGEDAAQWQAWWVDQQQDAP